MPVIFFQDQSRLHSPCFPFITFQKNFGNSRQSCALFQDTSFTTVARIVVEDRRLELLTPCVQNRCSPTELIPRTSHPAKEPNAPPYFWWA